MSRMGARTAAPVIEPVAEDVEVRAGGPVIAKAVQVLRVRQPSG
jgi:hypothetical protein